MATLHFIAVAWILIIHTMFILDPDMEFAEVDQARRDAHCPEFGYDK